MSATIFNKNKWNGSGSLYSYTMDVHDLLLHPPYTEHQLQDLQHDSSKHRLEDFSIIDLHNCLSCHYYLKKIMNYAVCIIYH